MTKTQGTATIILNELAALLRQTDPAALLIRKRLLRRVLWRHTPNRAHGFALLRRRHYVVDRQTLLSIVEPDELAPYDVASLPETVILLGRPNDLLLGPQERGPVLLYYWRLLFHAHVEMALVDRFRQEGVTDADIQRRIHQIGRTEFDEVVDVLSQEQFLFDPDDVTTAYIQFVALYLELQHFAPEQLHIFFPALDGRDDVATLIGSEIDGESIYRRTRILGSPDPQTEDTDAEEAASRTGPRPALPADVPGERQWAERAASRGNMVRSALLHIRLREVTAARDQLRRLAERVRIMLGQPDAAANEWYRALLPLLRPAAAGYWPAEARLLYDLQKACLASEQELVSVSMVRWLASLGREPVRMRVPGQQLVEAQRNLCRAQKWLRSAALSGRERDRLEALLEAALHHQEERIRDHFRPRILESLAAVGLAPTHVPETVARDKLVEELLDRVVEHGLLTMSDLRDALSRNQFKLDDLGGPVQFLVGDELLRLNSELARRMDNVYRPGEFYLRWMQSLSALLFGTPWGRLLVRNVLLPFGGAFIALKFCFFMYQEVGHLLPPPPSDVEEWVVEDDEGHAVIMEKSRGVAPHVVAESMDSDDGDSYLVWFNEERHVEARAQILWDPVTTPWSVAALGLFVFLMMRAPPFRRTVLAGLAQVGRGLRRVFIDGPAWVLSRPAVQAFLESAPVRLAQRFLVKPLLAALVAALVAYFFRRGLRTIEIAAAAAFVAACLLLLTRLGRIFDELLSNWLLEGAHNLGAEVVPAVIGAIADLFKRLMTTMERVLYGVDEWFRFRRQESSIMSAFKSVFGVIWLALSYVLRLLMVLIVEPTFNPLKHFPMVTVAGKFMVVFAAMMYEPLKQAMPAPWPAVIIFLIVFCVPGVFGFLVWELKENWRLYRANRAQTLRPVAVGHHGESVLRLLRPGFHSGTVPRTFARWRKAVRKGRAKAGFNAEHQLGHVREAIHRLMDREVLHLLARVQPVADLSLVTGRIHLGVTMIRVDLDSARHPATPLTLSFELKSGWLLARLVRSGWLDQLAAADQEVVRFAIEGLYRYAGTTLPEQRLREVVAPISTEFDVRQEKLLVWPGDDFRTRLAYPLDEASPVCPEVTPAGKPEDWLALDVAALVAGPVPIGWAEWVAFWDRHGAAREKAATPAKPELAAQPTG